MSQKPIRTCIKCRSKVSQKLLLRLQCVDKKLIPFTGCGRSFYICDKCLQDKDKLEKVLYRQCKNKDDYISQLEEIRRNG
jgi:predicted RNA-binding protein YlxR (DUF448 family)